MNTEFYVGQQVVCVDVSSPNGNGHVPSHLLKAGKVYTIAAVYECRFGNGIGVELNEISPAPGMRGFHSFRFRPVLKTDISIFTAMLAPTPSPEQVSA